MSGKIQLKFQWGQAKKAPFVSYPYWSVQLESGDNFKWRGYGIARATISREAWKNLIVQYVSYEKFLDDVMDRKPDFDVWLKTLISALKQIQLGNYCPSIMEKVKEDMMKDQMWGSDYDIDYFGKIIDDNKKNV